MLATEQPTITAAQIIAATSPATFFSCVQHIEASISARTLEILRSRNWKGPLTHEDWIRAEELVLDHVPISSMSRNHRLQYRLATPGYRPNEILFHLEGDLLCICGYAPRAERQAKMFYVRTHLPELASATRCAAWLQDSVLYLVMTRESSLPGLATAIAPLHVASAGMQYAKAM